MKIVNDFFNKLCGELDKTYFPEVKYYRDNENTTKIHYTAELFNNGCLTYPELIKRISKATKDTKENIHKIVSKYIENFDGYVYKPTTLDELRKKAEKAYEKNGQQGVYSLAKKHSDFIVGWGHCKACDCESPAIAEKECLVCGQPVDLK